MRNAVYKKYNIYHLGKFKEQISGTSKKSIIDYIRWFYVMESNEFKFKDFEVKLEITESNEKTTN